MFILSIYGIVQNITDKGLEYLKGVHTIYLWRCQNITDEGLECLKGSIIRR